jgi:hypothetical protein
MKTITLTKYNYPIHNKKLLVIIRVFKGWKAEIQGLKELL